MPSHSVYSSISGEINGFRTIGVMSVSYLAEGTVTAMYVVVYDWLE